MTVIFFFLRNYNVRELMEDYSWKNYFEDATFIKKNLIK